MSSPRDTRVETPPAEAPATTVIGGGIAGLLVALRLAEGGHRVTLLEAADRLGGQLAPQRLAGVELDAGAESFATRGTAVTALLTELGLDGDVVIPGGGTAWLHRARGAVPLPAAGVLGIPAHPLAPDVVRAIGLAGAWRARLDAVLPRRVGGDATTLGELVEARMGRAVLDALVTPVVRGVYSREPGDLPLAVAAPTLLDRLRQHGSLAAAVAGLRANAPAGSLVASLRGGMFRLAAALADACRASGVDLRTGVRVDALPPGRVVLAAPAPGAAPGRTVTVVTLVVRTPLLDGAPRGSGVLVAPGGGVEARALTHLTAKWDWIADAFEGAHALRLSYDGVPTDAVAQARRDASTIFGVDLPDPLDSAVRTWHRPAPETHDDGTLRTGEPVAGSGLAAVVAHAESLAAAILTDSRPAATGERMDG
ncbi:protoporphyrinogen/coproporphyrinogen oxidase [Pseudolysinimonas yzui]|uniref:Protoporphyrinogen oxidase n=1 Tax=Pseudolysinimonas yzui TaxID=2708254 RepID=A0A8J3DVJ6_9MICO|nr:FAD-dependent oxidoreductase [Pseudolysinimonas yzui]GHF04331.1 protoporphyrinogen oxidase [Pseudolysinimonas yzui]